MSSKILSSDDDAIVRAAQSLLDGNLIGLPTETVYGLAARGDREESVDAIFAAKGRPRNNPLILHVAEISDAGEIFSADLAPVVAKRLGRLSVLWPGPLTLIGPRHPRVLDAVTAGGDTVAIRIPNHPVAMAVLQTIKRLAGRVVPIAAPSANVSNYISPTTAAHVEAGLADSVDLILDGGPCQVGLESTIVYLGGANSPPEILRQGHYGAEEIRQRLGESMANVTEKSPVAAPGQFAKHYSPKTRLVLVEASTPVSQSKQVLRIDFNAADPVGDPRHWTFAPDGSLATAASRLYDVLRRADASGFERIEIVRCPESGIGIAIMDRLRRAAAHEDNRVGRGKPL